MSIPNGDYVLGIDKITGEEVHLKVEGSGEQIGIEAFERLLKHFFPDESEDVPAPTKES